MKTMADTNCPISKTSRLYLFLDTEFLPGERPVLLSIGLCDFFGREFYAELENVPNGPTGNELVDASVLPQLGQQGTITGDAATIGICLAQWLCDLAADRIEVCYDFHADYDLFEALLSSHAPIQLRLLPTHVGYLLADPQSDESARLEWSRQEVERGLSRHHALADAHALRARFAEVHGSVTPDQTAPSSGPDQQAAKGHADLILGDAAIAGLGDLAAGLFVDDGSLDDVLARKPHDNSMG